MSWVNLTAVRCCNVHAIDKKVLIWFYLFLYIVCHHNPDNTTTIVQLVDVPPVPLHQPNFLPLLAVPNQTTGNILDDSVTASSVGGQLFWSRDFLIFKFPATSTKNTTTTIFTSKGDPCLQTRKEDYVFLYLRRISAAKSDWLTWRLPYHKLFHHHEYNPQIEGPSFGLRSPL